MVERWNPWTDAAVMPMAESTHSHGNPTLALTNLSGTTASASNGLTLSLSAAAPGAGGGFAAQGSGTYTQNTGTIQFANSNGITFGLTANQMTASHDGLTTAQPPGAYLTTAMLSNASSAFAGINGAITGGSFTLNTAGASINLPAYITTAAQADHSHGNPTLALTNLAGTTASASNGLTISLSHNISTAAVPDHSHGNPTLNLTNIAGTTASASNGLTLSLSVAAPGAGSGTALNLTNLAGTLSANTAGISLSMSAAAPGGGGGFAAQGSGAYTQSTGTIVWANSNRVTFGLSTNQMTASIDAAGTGTSLNLTNLTGTLNVGSNGVAISMQAAAPGGGAAFAVYGQPTFAEGPPMVLITNLTGTALTNRVLLFPFFVHGNLTCRELMWYMSRATGGSNLFTVSQAFYTFVNSSQISRLASTSFQFSATNTASVSGIRIFELTPAQTTLSPGQYVLAMHFSGAATASVNYSLMGHSTLNWSPLGVIHPGADQNTISANATSHQLINFWGRHTTTTGAMPDTIGLGAVSGIGTLALPVKFWFGTHN